MAGTAPCAQAMDIALEGDAGVANRYMIHFKSDDRAMLQRFGIAWHYQSPGRYLNRPERCRYLDPACPLPGRG